MQSKLPTQRSVDEFDMRQRTLGERLWSGFKLLVFMIALTAVIRWLRS